MTLARQVNLEESGNNGEGSSGQHATREEEQSSETTEHHQSGQQVYSTLLTTRTPYIMRSDLYNHKGELDDPAYDTSAFNLPRLIFKFQFQKVCFKKQKLKC